MKFDVKVVLLGGLAFYIAQFVVSMITGPVVHDSLLVEAYRAHPAFWRPELNQEPPDMAALMPRWIVTGLLAAFIQAGIYDNVRTALSGSAAVRGVKFGFIAFLFHLCFSAGWSGLFNLPDVIWFWWNAEMLVVMLVGGAVLGFAAARLAPG